MLSFFEQELMLCYVYLYLWNGSVLRFVRMDCNDKELILTKTVDRVHRSGVKGQVIIFNAEQMQEHEQKNLKDNEYYCKQIFYNNKQTQLLPFGIESAHIWAYRSKMQQLWFADSRLFTSGFASTDMHLKDVVALTLKQKVCCCVNAFQTAVCAEKWPFCWISQDLSTQIDFPKKQEFQCSSQDKAKIQQLDKEIVEVNNIEHDKQHIWIIIIITITKS